MTKKVKGTALILDLCCHVGNLEHLIQVRSLSTGGVLGVRACFAGGFLATIKIENPTKKTEWKARDSSMHRDALFFPSLTVEALRRLMRLYDTFAANLRRSPRGGSGLCTIRFVVMAMRLVFCSSFGAAVRRLPITLTTKMSVAVQQ